MYNRTASSLGQLCKHYCRADDYLAHHTIPTAEIELGFRRGIYINNSWTGTILEQTVFFAGITHCRLCLQHSTVETSPGQLSLSHSQKAQSVQEATRKACTFFHDGEGGVETADLSSSATGTYPRYRR
jgi:hypothetical protein